MDSNSRHERLEARVSREQKELFKRAAALRGRTLTDFVISSAMEAANREIRTQQIISLSPEDSRAFVDALLHPTVPNARLRVAAKRYLSSSLA